MFSILIVFVIGFFIHEDIGGFSEAGQSLWDNKPDKFVREGNFTWEIILSFTILWPITVPMFPQLFSRFYIAEDDKAIRTAAWLYPTVVPILFLFLSHQLHTIVREILNMSGQVREILN